MYLQRRPQKLKKLMKKKRKFKKIFSCWALWLLLGLLAIFTLWFFTPIINNFLEDFHHMGKDTMGEVGDAFGSLNALFSALAFLGIIFTIFLQSKELRLQRKELTETRKVLIGQKREFSEQNKTLKLQRFENTFFQMLSLHNEIVEGLVINNKDNRLYTVKGVKDYPNAIERASKRDVFISLMKFMKKIYDLNYKDSKYEYSENILPIYEFIYKNFNGLLGHYYRNLYRIFVFLDEAELSDKEKEKYGKIIRAQFSDSELLMLFYNGLSDSGRNFEKYIERFALFDNLPRDSLLSKESHSRFYVKKAWGSNYYLT